MHNGSQGLNKRDRHQMRKHVGTIVAGRRGGTHTCGANHIVTSVQMGKLIGRLTKRKQEPREPILMHGERGQGGQESWGCNAGRGRPWETVHDASTNAWKVTECNSLNRLGPYDITQTRDQMVWGFGENPRPRPGLLGNLGLVWSRLGPNWSRTEHPQH